MRGPIHNTVLSTKTGKFIPKKRIFTVWLVSRADGDWSLYHCPDCRNPMVQYKGDLIAEIPGEAPHSYPFMNQCKNPNCGRKVLFKEAINQVV